MTTSEAPSASTEQLTTQAAVDDLTMAMEFLGTTIRHVVAPVPDMEEVYCHLRWARSLVQSVERSLDLPTGHLPPEDATA
ncbi:hypothetical protein SAMN04487972_102192 [Paracoccus halophilus]|uniref:Uncharacterized protein n=1 Tax=Paracoccus halophilus TaxID=376733 RepID=A0A099F8A3_9RHOB|nr:hypothetical protein [Paracoccus halophilus]KGJ06754.1 hypothetical protein IT41_00835 [Paracoccus halophilus]SFA41787.1 hypothetical protein SAMN04487972_102192 [Paracoccus halophilus]